MPLTRPLQFTTAAGEELGRAVARHGERMSKEAAVHDLQGTFAQDSVELLQREGVFAACTPRAAGGGGLESLYDLTVLLSRIACHDPAVATGAGMHLNLAWYYARTVRTSRGTEEDGFGAGGTSVEERWLSAMACDGMIVASTVAEHGCAPWQVETTARPTPGGWIVSGKKSTVSISPAATHFYARLKVLTEDGPVLGSAMIPADLPGVTVLDDWNGLGLRGSGSGQVIFDDVPVTAEHLRVRGPWGRRDTTAFEGRAASASPLSGIYLGIAEAAAEWALDRGLSRRVEPSAGLRAMVADLKVALATARGALHGALSQVDSALRDAPPRTLEASVGRALLEEGVIAALIVEREAIKVIDLAMQISGAGAYSAAHPLSRMYRDVRAASFMRPYAPPEQWVDFLAAPHFPE
ncbi:acyl-CoA dehydrogenase family protein [Streptomyces sp. NPDC056831]|uniref:acyl-CoA dehydrogenase family protein n=1 Tax=Streptomyces sp. NPDC056831 TaxID=3345954 RepID=UPI003697061C